MQVNKKLKYYSDSREKCVHQIIRIDYRIQLPARELVVFWTNNKILQIYVSKLVYEVLNEEE